MIHDWHSIGLASKHLDSVTNFRNRYGYPIHSLSMRNRALRIQLLLKMNLSKLVTRAVLSEASGKKISINSLRLQGTLSISLKLIGWASQHLVWWTSDIIRWIHKDVHCLWKAVGNFFMFVKYDFHKEFRLQTDTAQMISGTFGRVKEPLE